MKQHLVDFIIAEFFGAIFFILLGVVITLPQMSLTGLIFAAVALFTFGGAMSIAAFVCARDYGRYKEEEENVDEFIKQ